MWDSCAVQLEQQEQEQESLRQRMVANTGPLRQPRKDPTLGMLVPSSPPCSGVESSAEGVGGVLRVLRCGVGPSQRQASPGPSAS